MMVQTILLDIDGTLIDSNDAHARAWAEALKENGLNIEYPLIRRKIGMGGDHLLPQVAGFTEDSEIGQRISKRRGEIFRNEFLPELKPFPKTRDLVQKMLREGLELIVATSASEEDLQALLQQAEINDLLPIQTSAGDADRSKPSPDIVLAALKKSKSPKQNIIMLGDTPYDIMAAHRAGIRSIAFTCGGWRPEELSRAIAIYSGPWHLLEEYDRSPLSKAMEMPSGGPFAAT